MTKKDYIQSVLPIFQDRHTGLFGFIQNNNMYNLKEAIYKTNRAAVIARNKYCKQMEEMESYNNEMIPCPKCKALARREEIEKIGTCYNCYQKENEGLKFEFNPLPFREA